MQNGKVKRGYAIMVALAAVMLFAGFGNRKTERRSSWETESEQSTRRGAEIEFADVRHGEIFIPEELPPSRLLIDVMKDGRVSISDGAMTKSRLFAEIEKRVERFGKDFSVTIAVDKDAQYRDVAKVLDLCAEAGVRGNVSFLGMRSRRSGILSTLEAPLPNPEGRRSRSNGERGTPIKIHVGPDKQGVRVNGKIVSFEQLGNDFKKQATWLGDVAVVLACTPDAPHENLMRVLDICRECKVTCRLEEDLEEKVPLEKKESTEEAITPIKILIGKDSRIVIFGGRAISFEQLDRCIKKLSEESTETPVLLLCSPDSSHGSLVRVLDICYKYMMYKLAVLSM